MEEGAGWFYSLAACAFNRERAVFFLCSDEPGYQGAYEAQDGREGGGDGVLLFPHQGEGGWEDGGGYDDAHHEVEVAHRDTGVCRWDCWWRSRLFIFTAEEDLQYNPVENAASNIAYTTTQV